MAPKKPIKTTPRPEVKTEVKYEPKKTKTAKQTNEPGFGRRFILFIKDERTRFIVGLGLLLGVVFGLVSFISYFFTGANDQSKMDLSWSELQPMRGKFKTGLP